jgi:lysine decarboxylase
MAAISHADTEETVDRALEGLGALAREFLGGNGSGRSPRPQPTADALRTEQVVTPRDAFYAPAEMVKLDQAPGRLAAEFITPYPPGIPVVVPGERLTEEIVDYLKTGAAEGIYAEGLTDQTLASVRVMA